MEQNGHVLILLHFRVNVLLMLARVRDVLISIYSKFQDL